MIQEIPSSPMSCFSLTTEDKETKSSDVSCCLSWYPRDTLSPYLHRQGVFLKTFSLNVPTFPALASLACHPFITPSCLGISFQPQPRITRRLLHSKFLWGPNVFLSSLGKTGKQGVGNSRETVLQLLSC